MGRWEWGSLSEECRVKSSPLGGREGRSVHRGSFIVCRCGCRMLLHLPLNVKTRSRDGFAFDGTPAPFSQILSFY